MSQRRLKHTRHAPGRAENPARGLPQVYRGRGRRAFSDVYDADHPGTQRGGKFRWLISTLMAAAVGTLAIGVAIYAALEPDDGGQVVLMPDGEGASGPVMPRSTDGQQFGLNWFSPKTDRLEVAADGTSIQQIIHDQIQVKRDNRPFIQIKPYVRMYSRLTLVPARNADVIPPFNPLKLFASQETSGGASTGEASAGQAQVRVVDVLGGELPVEDGQELDGEEVLILVETQEAGAGELSGEGLGAFASRALVDGGETGGLSTAIGANTSVLAKTSVGNEPSAAAEELMVLRAAKGDTLQRILQRIGTEPGAVKAIVDAARTVFPEQSFGPGLEVHVTLAVSNQPAVPGRQLPQRVAVFGDGEEHKVSISRQANGGYTASAVPGDDVGETAADQSRLQSESLYASVYNALLLQGLKSDDILDVLRIHAYETDFRTRVTPSDNVELFFDTLDVPTGEAPPDELLFTAIASGGALRRFWRFRTPDSIVDFFDEFGHNSKKFLMRRPVRGENVRLTSGFGFRFHPLLNERRMHTGVDWAAPPGTPILAAGSGVVEMAERRGQYGNHVLIRHANGYHTSYSHLQRFAPAAQKGARVRQGQVIGYVGSTGLSSGPHLHYEVMVSKRHVDPLRIQVPQERRLSGKQLADFQRERSRIDELMRRAPVKTENR